MDAAAFAAAGLYDPGAPAAADRLTLLQFLMARGASLAELVAAERDGVLFALSSQLAAFGPVEQLTLGDVAERSGTTTDRIRRMLLAQGIPVDETTLVSAFVVDDVVAFEAGAALFGDEATVAFSRVMGASVARIVEAAISLFYGEISPTMAVDASELERAKTNEAAGAVFSLLPSVVTHLMEQRFRLDSVRVATTRGDAVGQTTTVGIGFVDLVGSTAWAEHLSLKDHSLALSRFESAAWDIATGHGGRVVKLIGDAAMIVAESAETTCRIAVALCGAVTGDAGLPGARGAVGFGDVTARGGDYVGPLVNLVARSVKVADEGSVVVTADVRDRLPRAVPWIPVDAGTHVLRGIDTPVAFFTLRAAPDGAGEGRG